MQKSKVKVRQKTRLAKMLVNGDSFVGKKREIKAKGIDITRLSLVDRAASKVRLLYKSTGGMQQIVKGTERGEILTLAALPNRKDTDKEFMGQEAVVAAAHSWAKNGMQIDIMHAALHGGRALTKSEAYAAESWIVAKGDPRFEGWEDTEGNPIDATGGWAALIKLEDPILRQAVRSGELDGSSVFGWAEREVAKEDNEMDNAEFQALLKQSNEQLLAGITTSLTAVVKSLVPQPATPAPEPKVEAPKAAPAPVIKFKGDPKKAEDLAKHREELVLASCDLSTEEGLVKWEAYLAEKNAKATTPPTNGASTQPNGEPVVKSTNPASEGIARARRIQELRAGKTPEGARS